MKAIIGLHPKGEGMPAQPEKIRVKCPSCGKEWKTSPAKAEQPIRCPICGEENIFTRIEGEETRQAAVVATKKANYILPVLFIAFVGIVGWILLRDDGSKGGAAPAPAYVTQISDLQKMADAIPNILQDALPLLPRREARGSRQDVPTIGSIPGIETVSGLAVESSWILVSSPGVVRWVYCIENHAQNTVFAVPVFVLIDNGGNILEVEVVPVCLDPKDSASDCIDIDFHANMTRNARCFLVVLPFHMDMFSKNGLLHFFRSSSASSHIQDVTALECWWMPRLPKDGRFRVDYCLRLENRSSEDKEGFVAVFVQDKHGQRVIKGWRSIEMSHKTTTWMMGCFFSDLDEIGISYPTFSVTTYEAIEKDIEKSLEAYKKKIRK